MKPKKKAAQPAAKAKVAKKNTAVRAKSTGAAKPARKTIAPLAPRKTAPLPVRPALSKPLQIPAILLEGDPPPLASSGGPGGRFVLGDTPPESPIRVMEVPEELPEAYGTGKLILTARDPHWLYAAWDLTPEQRRHYNGLAAGGHLVLRAYLDEVQGSAHVETPVLAESRNWFIPVSVSGAKYVAVLGYRTKAGDWKTIATSQPAFTPSGAVSEDSSAQFATLPAKAAPLIETVKHEVQASVESAPIAMELPPVPAQEEQRVSPAVLPVAGKVQEVPAPVRSEPAAPVRSAVAVEPERKIEGLPAQRASSTLAPAPASAWTPAQESALAELIRSHALKWDATSSLEIMDLLRRQLEAEAGPAAAVPGPGQPGKPDQPGEHRALPEAISSITAVFSPSGQAGKPRSFWFNVNAELIIYGATEPEAAVMIGNRRIKLRPDGTFSLRFALPDGEFELPVTAVAADHSESRSAGLRFSRETEYRGEVGAHPQDGALKEPRISNVA